jgi:hypothetical protein
MTFLSEIILDGSVSTSSEENSFDCCGDSQDRTASQCPWLLLMAPVLAIPDSNDCSGAFSPFN